MTDLLPRQFTLDSRDVDAMENWQLIARMSAAEFQRHLDELLFGKNAPRRK